MGRRRRYLPWVVCAVFAAAGVPALALGQADPPSSASIVASDTGFHDASSSDPEDRTVDIAVGGKVNFSYPSGDGVYNVVWDRDSPQPASCEQTAGPVWGYGTTLPWWMQGPGWAGNCTFTKAGTYTFHSGVDPNKMKGTVVVHEAPTPTPTPTATPTATPVTRPGVVAHDSASPVRNWFQDASSSDPADNTVTVDKGATVDFSYPAGSSAHNVVFATAPTSCVQKTGVVITPAPPLPSVALPASWTGECRFDTPGVYTFVCSTHTAEMKGSVVVKNDDGSEPTPVPTVSPTPTPTPEPPRHTTPAPVPKPWAAIDKPAVKAMTVASLLSGKLKIVARCVSAGSGTLTLSVSKAVAREIGLKGTKIGSASATCDGHGRFTVKVRPTAAARRALEDWRGSVRVTATLAMAGPIGQATATRKINLKGRGRAR